MLLRLYLKKESMIKTEEKNLLDKLLMLNITEKKIYKFLISGTYQIFIIYI